MYLTNKTYVQITQHRSYHNLTKHDTIVITPFSLLPGQISDDDMNNATPLY